MSKSNRSGKSTCLTKTQLEEFLSNLPVKFSLLAETMYFSAGRVGEISSLKVRNINFQEGLIILERSSTKCNETRQIPIPMRLLDDLKDWILANSLQPNDYIFFTQSRNTKYTVGTKKLSIQSIDEYFRKVFDWIDVPGASTHSFRRTRLTHLLHMNWNCREIMDISGHKNLLSLQQYLDSDKATTFNKYRSLIEKDHSTIHGG